MRHAIILAALLASACGGQPKADEMDCRPIPELTGGETAITITVERKGGDLVWQDLNKIEHRITAAESWQWRCVPHREF